MVPSLRIYINPILGAEPLAVLLLTGTLKSTVEWELEWVFTTNIFFITYSQTTYQDGLMYGSIGFLRSKLSPWRPFQGFLPFFDDFHLHVRSTFPAMFFNIQPWNLGSRHHWTWKKFGKSEKKKFKIFYKITWFRLRNRVRPKTGACPQQNETFQCGFWVFPT